MADDLRMALTYLLRKAEMAGEVDFLREGVRILGQALMDLEVSQHFRAEKNERTSERTGQRKGYRPRQWDTRVGTVELQVPRVRDGSFFSSLLELRRRAERALVGVVQEAYVQGVSTRRVDDLVKALGMTVISKSQVSRLCEELDSEVERFRNRRLTEEYPYVWLDATFLKVRQEGRHRLHGRGDRHRGNRHRRAGGIGAGRGSFRGRRVLAAVSAEPGIPRPERGSAGDERFPPGVEERDRGDAVGELLAAVPDAHHAQRVGPCAEVRNDDGGDDDPHGVRTTGCVQHPAAMAPGIRLLPRPVPAGGGADGRGGRRRTGVRGLPRGALAADLVEQSAGESQQGDQAAHERGGDLPEPRIDCAPGGFCALRAA